jgi:hypothetical protein
VIKIGVKNQSDKYLRMEEVFDFGHSMARKQTCLTPVKTTLTKPLDIEIRGALKHV